MDRFTGLTLIELLTTLAISALLTLLASPSLIDYLARKRLHTASAQLHSDLHHARLTAISGNRRIAVCPGTPARGCLAQSRWAHGWLVFEDDNRDRQWQPAERLLHSSQAVTPLQVQGNRLALVFFPNGTAPGSNATLIFCNPQRPQELRELRISLSGHIRQLATAAAAPGACSSP